MRTWIKICATTCIEDALASIEAGADALGFVFAPSKRQVTVAQAREIALQLPKGVERIGVFTDEVVACVADAVEQVGLTGVQLHGDEDPDFIAELKARVGCPIKVIKTVLVDDHFEARFGRVVRNYDGIDSILLDSGSGSGRTLDWQKVQPLLERSSKPLIVAGGLNVGNVGEAMRKFSPWGVDVASGVEQEPGRKDTQKLKAFIAAVRRAEQS